MSIRIMSRVWKAKIGGSLKLTLLALADNANDEGYCWPSIATIARKVGVSRRYTIDKIQELESIGYIKHERMERLESNNYCIKINDDGSPGGEPNKTYFEKIEKRNKKAKTRYDKWISQHTPSSLADECIEADMANAARDPSEVYATTLVKYTPPGVVRYTPLESSLEPSMNHHEEPQSLSPAESLSPSDTSVEKEKGQARKNKKKNQPPPAQEFVPNSSPKSEEPEMPRLTITDQIGLRQKIEQALKDKGIDDLGVDMAVSSAVIKFLAEDERPAELPHTVEEQKQSTLQALARGAKKNESLEAEWTRLFRTQPNWDTKTNREIMLWLKERPPEQTLERFAAWWFAEDFRGQKGSPPIAPWVKEFWLKAFESNPQAPRRAQDTGKRSGPLPKGV